MSNVALATELIQQLSRYQVREYVVCAGARNAPLVKALSAAAGVKLHFQFDERAAAFFALGRSKRNGLPVAVVTTSGTAVAELLPAAIEAYYSGVQLVLVTADRPKNYRGSGAPQAIEQANIFTCCAEQKYDIDALSEVVNLQIAAGAPTHINVCFSEPLIDADIKPICLPNSHHERPYAYSNETEFAFNANLKFKKPLIILGGLGEQSRNLILEALVQLQLPILAEAHSGLRECTQVQPLLVNELAEQISHHNFKRYFDAVIRVGSVPTTRLWRDLEDKLSDIPVLCFSQLRFSGLARNAEHPYSLESFLTFASQYKSSFQKYDLPKLHFLYSEKIKLLNEFSRSEPAYFLWLSRLIPEKSFVFLGNSLPIREWDFASEYNDKNRTIASNRGANGIDGLIATFLGQAKEENENWLILGDLSALYDLNALAILATVRIAKLRIVVVNNRGGQIFKRMFNDSAFLNEHSLDFKYWAKMFNVSYLCVTEPTEIKLTDAPTVIEILPSNSETEQFWQAYVKLKAEF